MAEIPFGMSDIPERRDFSIERTRLAMNRQRQIGEAERLLILPQRNEDRTEHGEPPGHFGAVFIALLLLQLRRLIQEVERFMILALRLMESADVSESCDFSSVVADCAVNRQRLIVEIDRLLILAHQIGDSADAVERF